MAETTTPAADRTAIDYRDLADKLRNRVDLFGKTLAAVATLGTTAVGLSEIGDLLPADGNEEWVVLACVSLLAAGLAAIAVAVELMKVARPVFMRADLANSTEITAAEQTEVVPVFEAAANRLRILDARGPPAARAGPARGRGAGDRRRRTRPPRGARRRGTDGCRPRAGAGAGRGDPPSRD
jgi:hypothetical protein